MSYYYYYYYHLFFFLLLITIGAGGIQEEKVVADESIQVTSCTCILAQCKLIKSIYKCTADSECKCYYNSKKYAPEYCECSEKYCTKSKDMLNCNSVNTACKCAVK